MNVEDIVKLAQISSALEVSGYPKPGNVHRTRDYDDMVFEDFVISGIVIGNDVFSLSGTALALIAGVILNLILKEKAQ